MNDEDKEQTEVVSKKEAVSHTPEISDVPDVAVFKSGGEHQGDRKKQKIVISQEKNMQADLAEEAVPETIANKKSRNIVVFVSGTPKDVQFNETEAIREIKQQDGTKIVQSIPAKILSFPNGICETDDPVLIELAVKHPKFGREFFFHKDHIPEDFVVDTTTARQKTNGVKLSGDTKANFAERQRRVENARYFDKDAHKEEGDYGKLVSKEDAKTVGLPENEAPNPISEW